MTFIQEEQTEKERSETQTTTRFVHPEHPIPADVDDALRSIREDELAAVARDHQLTQLGRPTDQERRSIAEAYGHTLGVDVEARLFEIRKTRATRVRNATEALRPKPVNLIPTLDQPGTMPVGKDPTFWWARTDAGSTTSFYSASFDPKGLLHFGGALNKDSQSLTKVSFGAVALFELQWDRLPFSPSGRWRSSPHVELFGGIHGWADDGNFWTGDCWSKCWMVRRHTIRQTGVFPGGMTVDRGSAEEAENLINLDNDAGSVQRGMPGFQPMPSVVFGNVVPFRSLWAEVEVRFDIQVEGNSHMWMYPEVILRTHQWPLVAA